jgi:hypothetical protein
MPNWITNNIKAPPAVIAAMLNTDGQIDFNLMMPSPTPYGNDWELISYPAETAANAVLGVALSDNPVTSSLEFHNRQRTKVADLPEMDFEQFIAMLRNYRACGYLHCMDFARKAWGTKWNACEQSISVDDGIASFETAWSCPLPILKALSKRFPSDEISVEFADEDIGANCGSFSLLNGEFVKQDIAPGWGQMSEEEKAKWMDFARGVKGWAAEGIEE